VNDGEIGRESTARLAIVNMRERLLRQRALVLLNQNSFELMAQHFRRPLLSIVNS
jgi:hypothetical protein